MGSPRLITVLSVFVDGSGTVIAATHAPDTVDVIQMESELADGRVVNTRNYTTTGLREPAEISVTAFPLDTDLLVHHRSRVNEAT